MTGVFLLSNAATPLYAHWQSVWGFDSGLLTVVFAAYMVGLIASLVVAGRLADRFGRKAVLVPGLVAAVVSSVLFLGAQDVVWLLAARLLAGVAVGAAVTAGMAAVVDLAPARRRRTGSLIASVSMVFGAGLGPLLAGGLAAASRRPQTLVFSVVLGVELAALAVAIALPLKRPAAPPPRRPVARSGARLFVWPSPPRRNRRELRRGIGAFGPGLAATSFVLSLGPTVLNSVGVSGTLAAGAVVCAMFLAATGVQFALARLTTRTHLVLSSVAAVAASVLVVLAVTVAPTAVLAISGFLLAGAAQGLGQLAGLSLIAAHVPADKRAESNAVLNIGGYVPAGVLAVLTGYASDAFGLPTAVALFGAVLAAAALTALAALAAVGRRAGHQRTAAAAEGE
nr:MFS transporter [Streptomyces sp. NBC_00525]